MTATFERVICYEDRGSVQTHSWLLEGVKTTPTGNTDAGRLWADFTYSGSMYTVDLYKSAEQESADKVASGQSGSLGEIDLSEANSSGLTDVEIFNAATASRVVDLGDDTVDSADGVFYFSGAASLAYNTPYYVKATVNKGGDSYSTQAGLVRI